MCEYMIVDTNTKIPKCKDGSRCLTCILGNGKKYKELKNKEKE